MGREGERRAAQYLRQVGYKVLLRNVRLGRGEVDLICRHGQILVFVEVKTRHFVPDSRPADAMTVRKQKLLIHASMLYLRELDLPNVVYRFDVVEVVHTLSDWQINLIANALPSPRGSGG